MRRGIFAIALLATAAPVLSQDAAGTRHEVAPGSPWSIDDSDCMIDVGFGDDIGVAINPHDDHHDFGLYDPAMKGVVDQKLIPITFTAGTNRLKGPYQAVGHKNADATSYVSNVDDLLLDAVAASEALQVHRGRTLLADLDMTGFSAALAAMRACEVKMSDNAALAADAADAADASDAAADAAAKR